MRHSLLILLFLSLIPFAAYSQNCGLSDTIYIQNNSTSTIDFTITDYFNDDLSDPMQGLCGVELHFFHQLSENLELTLTSPAGQSVELIGPNTDDNLATTFFAKWKITFLQCGATAEPDLGYLAQWDNDQPNNFVNGGQYSGSYYPYNGCLEDFNTGPVNGQWTFSVNNDPSNYPGAFVFIRLIFCDARGVDCCFAVPGDMQSPDLLTCEGDSSLIFDPVLNFPTGPADTSEYGYEFTIFQDSLLIAYDSTVNLINYPAGEYEVCGFSYRKTEVDSLPLADGTMNLGVFRDSLDSLEPWFCGKLTDSCMTINIVATPDPVLLNETICAGDSIMVGDTTLYQAGFHNIVLTNYAGCDSMVNVTLQLEQPTVTLLDSIICFGDSVEVASSVYYNSGIFSDTLQTYDLGCDSIINLNLTVLQPVINDTIVTICAGESFMVGDSTFTDAGNYSVPLISSQGCDSIVNLALNILDVEAIVTEPDTINCTNESIYLDGSNSQPIGILSYDWYTINGTYVESGLLPEIGSAGSYYLEVSATENMTTCFSRDTVEVIEFIEIPVADAGVTDTINCFEPEVTIGGVNTSIGSQFEYNWETDTGDFVSATDVITPIVDGEGLYTLIVTDLRNGCSDTSEVFIELDTLAPIAEAGDGFIINCLTLEDTLTAVGSSVGAEFGFQWNGPCLETDATAEEVIASCAGTYYLEVANSDNGCFALDSVMVFGNHVMPEAVISFPDTLNCYQDEIMLNGSSSLPPDSLSYIWEGPGIISDNDIANPTINLPGVYSLTVSNIYNFCTNTVTTTVIENLDHPTADAGEDAILTCLEPEIMLGGPTTSIGDEFTYIWFTDEGHFTGDQDTPSTSADSSGIYQLEVINEINGCRDTSVIILGVDQEVPFVDAGNDDEFVCGDDFLILDGTGSDTSQNLSVSWTGPCINTAADSLIIEIGCAGTYFLELTDVDSGCQAQDTVVISTNTAALFAVLPDSASISCEMGSVVLDGSASSMGFYKWLLNGEGITLTGNSPTVQEAGYYELIVSNLNETCIDTAGIEVILDCDFEVTLAFEPQQINCSESISQIEIEVSPNDIEYEYSWQGPAPTCLIEPADGPIVEVLCAGDYSVIVTNPAVGISDTLIIEVKANEDVPIANAGVPDSITCDQTPVFLDGSGSSTGLTITYLWTNIANPNDTISQTVSAEVFEAGIYALEVTDTLNNCSAFDVVQIFQDNTIPDIVFGSSVFLCESDTFALQSFVSPESDQYVYNWTGEGIVGMDSSTLLIDTIGQFILEVENVQNGCSASDTVIVEDQVCIPCIEILPSGTLDCNVESLTLQAMFCEPCVDCEVLWTTDNGWIVAGNNTLNPLIGMPGIYTLTVTDTLGYAAIQSVEVIGNDQLPVVDSGPDRQLTCDSITVTLGSNLTETGDQFVYTWSALNGSPFDPPTALFTTVSDPDTFVLAVENVLTGCVNMDSVIVTIDTLAPIADAGPGQLLTCEDPPFVILDGSGSSFGNNIDYQWETAQAGCLSGENTISPIASCEGTYLLTVTDLLNGCSDTSSTVVGLANDIPEINPIEADTLNCGVNSVVLTGNTPTQVTDFAVSWCPLDEFGNPVTGQCQDQISMEVFEPGEFLFEVIDTFTGCSNQLIVTVEQDTISPMVDAGGDSTLLCNQDSLVLSGMLEMNDGQPDFVWTSNSGQQINNPQSLNPVIYGPGIYYLNVTNTENQCTAIDSMEVVLDINTPVVEAGQDTLLTCEITEIELSGTGSTTSGDINFVWSTEGGAIQSGDSTATPVITQTGWYYLEVTDLQNGCLAQDSLFVSESIETPSAIITDWMDLELTCTFDTLLLDATGSVAASGAAISFEWQEINGGHLFDDLTADTVWVDESGEFRLIVTDQINGCSDSLQFIVTEDFIEPEIIVEDPDDLTCIQEEINIDASSTDITGREISWSTEEDGVLLVGETTLTVNTSDVYLVTLLDLNNGCSSTMDVYVGIDTVSPVVIIENVTEMLDCEVREVKIDARNSSTGSQFEYQWTANPGEILTGQDSLVSWVGAAGNYTLEIINTENGCIASDWVEVEESSAPVTGVMFTSIDPGCLDNAGGSITVDSVLGGTPTYLFSLNESSFTATNTFGGLSAGLHELVITDENGCSWTEVITMLEADELIVDLGPDIELVLGDSVKVEALINRQSYDTLYWMPSDVFDDPSNPVQVLNPGVTTAYSVFVVDENGCTDSDIIIINLIKPRQYFIPNVFSPHNADGQNDVFMIFGGPEVKEILTFQVYDRWGNLVHEKNNFQPNNPLYGWDGRLDGRLMNSAVFAYYVRIEFVDGWIEDAKGDVILMR